MMPSVDLAAVGTWLQALLDRAQALVLSAPFAVQAAAVLAALAIAALLAPGLRALLAGQPGAHRIAVQLGIERVLHSLATVALPLLWMALQWLSIVLLLALGWPVDVLRVTAGLLTAWVAIGLLSGLIANATGSRLVTAIVWLLAAMLILGILDDVATVLDAIALSLGGVRISVLGVVKSLLTLALLLWAAALLTRLFDRRVARHLDLAPSLQLLLGKMLRFVLVVLAVLFAMAALGIDLTALALFGGAVGIGLGLGLRPIVGNLVSGLLMLIDRSIRPGDIVTVGDTLGWVESLNARYTSVRTRDGVEHLIPNEQLVTTRVENWSHSDRLIRLRAPIGISYRSDLRLAIALCIEAAGAVERVVAEPGPRCLLRGFGNSAVELELRFWIEDPENGRANVTSEVLLGVWDRFHANGIEIPFPQLDLHMKTPETLSLRLNGDGDADRT